MVCERTRAVLSSFLEDVKRIAFITACIVQGVFIVFYAYSIFNNLDKLVFLIIYLILFVLSVVWFTVWLIKRKQKKRIKKIILIATGALLSSVSSQQGESIPGIAHLLNIKND